MKFTYPKGYTGGLPLCPFIFSWCILLSCDKYGYHIIRGISTTFLLLKLNFCSLHFSALSNAPQNVSGFNTSSTSINLTWQLIPYKPRISYYKINIAELVSGTLVGQINSTGLVQHIDGLRGYTHYVFTVCGVNTVGDGPSSVPVIISTDMDGKYGFVDWHYSTVLVRFAWFFKFQTIKLLQPSLLSDASR